MSYVSAARWDIFCKTNHVDSYAQTDTSKPSLTKLVNVQFATPHALAVTSKIRSAKAAQVATCYINRPAVRLQFVKTATL